MIGSNTRELAPNERVDWLGALPLFVMWGVGVFGPLFTGVSAVAFWTGLALYVLRMFFITGFYHRYFSHRSYHMGRGMQFVAAVCGCTAVQRGPPWWASHHRDHHTYSDTDKDVHSRHHCSGFWSGLYWSHVGWVLCRKFRHTHAKRVPDLLRFPELRWLDKGNNHLYPAAALALATWLWGWWLGEAWGTSGLQMLVVGFFTSTFFLSHGTFTINSFAHLWGRRRYQTGDDSRNNLGLAVITLGEGWHNNHHHEQGREAQAETRWEKCFDWTHWGLVLMSKLGLVTLRRST